MDGGDTTKLNVSLEPHLLEVLKPLTDLLPPPLADELKAYTLTDMIPYSTLLAVSHWSRTPEGTEKLQAHCPPLQTSSYMMVSLLAGVKTSPERVLGSYRPPPEPEQLAAQQKRERQEITAILNALLSIVGVGFATWWAADKLHWSNQWVQCLYPCDLEQTCSLGLTARSIGPRHVTCRCHCRKWTVHYLAIPSGRFPGPPQVSYKGSWGQAQKG